MDKIQNLIILIAIGLRHRQNPIESNWYNIVKRQTM
jgi:hypothetical protein